MDQNITTVLTTLITVLGTLGGVILGVVLSNRYVARQEKAKRNTVVIEEVYTLLIQINKWMNDVSVDMSKALDDKNPQYVYIGKRYDEIKPTVDRITMLVRLYIPQVREVTEKFFDHLEKLRVSSDVYFVAETREHRIEEVAYDSLQEAGYGFDESYENLLSSLEKLIR